MRPPRFVLATNGSLHYPPVTRRDRVPRRDSGRLIPLLFLARLFLAPRLVHAPAFLSQYGGFSV